jgi:hypothetical protein
MVTLLGVKACAFAGVAIMSMCDPGKLYARGVRDLMSHTYLLCMRFLRALAGLLGKAKKKDGVQSYYLSNEFGDHAFRRD